MAATEKGEEADSRCILEAKPTRLGGWVVGCGAGERKRIMNIMKLHR